MKIAIVDDIAADCENAERVIKKWGQSHLCAVECDVYSDGSSFLLALGKTRYDLVFMDINMGEPNGIETAFRLHDVYPYCLVVFLTTSSEHMPDAFSTHAYDYVIKPTTDSRLFRILDEAEAVLPENQPFLNIIVNKQTLPLLYSDIRYITSDSQYCIVHTDKPYRSRISFKELEQKLSGDNRFLILNRGILVNLDHVNSMENTTCIMQSGENLPMNTRKKAQLHQALIAYRFERRIARMRRKEL